jgi:hypothetical protein
VVHAYNPSYMGDRGRRILVQAGQNTWDPIWKTTEAKKAGDVFQVVDRLPRKHEALSSNSKVHPPKKYHKPTSFLSFVYLEVFGKGEMNYSFFLNIFSTPGSQLWKELEWAYM